MAKLNTNQVGFFLLISEEKYEVFSVSWESGQGCMSNDLRSPGSRTDLRSPGPEVLELSFLKVFLSTKSIKF